MKKYFIIFFMLCFLHSHAQIITTIAGNGTAGTGGDGGAATAASLEIIAGLVKDAAGNLYIGTSGDSLNGSTTVYWGKIRKVSPGGIISTFAGIDTFGFSGDGGPASSARMGEPECIVTDKKGNLYFYDYGNYRVRKIDNFGIITTFAGNGSITVSGDGGPATAAGIGYGLGVCADTFGNIYIAAGNKIRRVDTFGIITTYAGTGAGVYNGDNIPATSANFGTEGEIAFDQHGNLFIADNTNNRIRKIAPGGTEGSGRVITTVAGNGTAGYSGDNGPATNAELYEPMGVYPDRCGNVYITDWHYNRVRVIDGDGIIKVVAGNGYNGGTGHGGFSGDGGPAMDAELFYPGIIYLDQSGNIYIGDSYNGRVRYIHMDSCVNTTAAANVTKEAEALSVWPNPSSGIFSVRLSSVITEGAEVWVKDVVGRTVKHISTTTNKETEILLHEPSGVYFISVTTLHGRWVQRVLLE